MGVEEPGVRWVGTGELVFKLYLSNEYSILSLDVHFSTTLIYFDTFRSIHFREEKEASVTPKFSPSCLKCSGCHLNYHLQKITLVSSTELL